MYVKTVSPENAEPAPGVAEPTPENAEPAPEIAEPSPENAEPAPDDAEPSPEVAEPSPDDAEPAPGVAEPSPEDAETAPENAETAPENGKPASENGKPPSEGWKPASSESLSTIINVWEIAQWRGATDSLPAAPAVTARDEAVAGADSKFDMIMPSACGAGRRRVSDESGRIAGATIKDSEKLFN